MARKAFETKIDKAGHQFVIRRMQYFTSRFILLGDQHRVGERLVDAIEATQYQQDQRKVIQTTYQTYRKTRDKFEGESKK